MMPSETTDGVRVVTQAIPLLSSESAQCPSEYKDKKNKVSDTPYMTRMFLKGEPVPLGTLQILIGIVMITLGAITWSTQTLYGEIPLGLGLSIIFSGSVTLGAHMGTSPPFIKSAIALNIISALLAMSSICYFCYALAIKNNLSDCKTDTGYYYYYDCQYMTDSLQNLLYGIKGMLLILAVLELCVCMTTVVFSCKANASGTKMVRLPEGGGDGAGPKKQLGRSLNREVASPPALSLE